MTLFVVDASVAVKWFLMEIHSDAARRLLWSLHRRFAPELIFAEVSDGLLKHHRGGEISRLQVAQALSELTTLISARTTVHLTTKACGLAVDYDRSAYDALYVALAVDERCQLVTADRRLYSALAPHLPETMLWIEDVPDPAG